MSALRERGGLLWNGLLDLIYPPRCLVCGVWLDSDVLCVECIRAITPVAPPFCSRCGAPAAFDSATCAACAGGSEPPYLWSQVLGQYTGSLRTAIHRLKYDGKTALAEPLGRLLARAIDIPVSLGPTTQNATEAMFDAVVPVPLHPSRERERGYNQAERLASVLARERRWRLDADALIRSRRTRTQTALNLKEREANVQGAFTVRGEERFAGASVLIVDDVLTTSATLSACAHAARASGAVRVCVVALARGI